ncbi:MAG: MBL fold metallo-hydrolase [Gracilibacter sp. BRH_c7a]|nr:MAG: MBL fold metallo-hydrolase [Gracilibacter sp. BRH_c7a]
MRITVLGCWGAYPQPGEATSGYLLQTDKHNILLDCGSGVLANLFKFINKEDLDAAIISHFHHDHSADIGCLQYASKFAMVFKKRDVPLPIYANTKSNRFADLTYEEYTVGKEISPNISLDLDGLKVSFRETVHREYNLAMRLEYEGKVLIYTGDLGPETDLASFCTGADLIICETSLFEHESGLFPGHMTTRETAEMAQKAGAKKLILTHFPHVGNIRTMPTEAAKYFTGIIHLAEINKVFET